MKSKKSILFWGVLAVILSAAGVAAFIYFKNGFNNGREKNNGFSSDNMPAAEMQFPVSEEMTLAGGVTNMGVTGEVFEVENLTAKLEIEEVYVSAEDEIEKGTKVLKLSEASIAGARKELEKTLREADLAYRAGKIEYEQSRITLQYERDSKVLEGGQAEAVYTETLAGLQNSVDQAREELEDAQEEIAEYQSYVNDNSYKSYFKVDEYQEAYDKTLEALKDKMDYWGVSWSQVTGGGSLSGDIQGKDEAESTGPGRDQIQVLASLYKVLEEHEKNLEEAEKDYEEALVNAAFELQTLELKIPELEQNLTEAEKNYQTQLLQAEVAYEKALANAESAGSDYEAALRKAETNLEKLESDRTDAEENLALFESSVGDGYFYASGSGTILRTMVKAGEELAAEGIVFVYSNPEEMTVTVSVNQTDIAGIALDDKVYIQTEEHGAREGVVTKIDPVSGSDSRTDVTYNVVVKFTDGPGEVSANESVIAIFGMGEAPENDDRGSMP